MTNYDHLSKHPSSSWLEVVRVSSLLLVLFIEATLFMTIQQWNLIHFLFLFLLISCLLLFLISQINTSPTVYLVDFSCLKPPSLCKVSNSTMIKLLSQGHNLEGERLEVVAKIVKSLGYSDETYIPPQLSHIPVKTQQRDSIKEAHMTLFPVMEDLLSKTRISPSEIDILIVNCSVFCPSPSLSSIMVHKFKMRSDVKTYNLSGMGCSAGAIAIDLARNLLKTYTNSNAVVISTEVLSAACYTGDEISKMLANCHIRMGSAAILLTNKKEPPKPPKYKLLHAVRTQRAFEDTSYLSLIYEEDTNGIVGITTARDWIEVARKTLRETITVIGGSILPLSEKLRYVLSMFKKRPDFKKAVEHFCMPTAGRAVIKEIREGLGLGEGDVEGAAMALRRFGYQSSASMWYEVAYMEAKEKVKKGDKVWQLGLGTGPKSYSLVWECVNPIVGESQNGPWADCIHNYPIVHF